MLDDNKYHQHQPSLASADDDTFSRSSSSSVASGFSNQEEESLLPSDVNTSDCPGQSSSKTSSHSPTILSSRMRSILGSKAKTDQYLSPVETAAKRQLNVTINSSVCEEGERIEETDYGSLSIFWDDSKISRQISWRQAHTKLALSKANLKVRQIDWAEVDRKSVEMGYTEEDRSLTAASKEQVYRQFLRWLDESHKERGKGGKVMDELEPWVNWHLRNSGYLPSGIAIPTKRPTDIREGPSWNR